MTWKEWKGEQGIKGTKERFQYKLLLVSNQSKLRLKEWYECYIENWTEFDILDCWMGLVKLHFLQPDLQNLTNKSPADLNLLSFNSPQKLEQTQEQWLLMFAVCRKRVMQFPVPQVKARISNTVVMNEFLDLHALTKDHSPWREELHPRDTV